MDARRRAVLVVASAWAVVWAALGLVIGAAILLWAPAEWAAGPSAQLGGVGFSLVASGAAAVAFGLRGAISGIGFALLLRRLERGRRVDELSPARLLVWGNAIGSLWTVLSVVVGSLVDPGPHVLWRHLLLPLLGHGVLATAAVLFTLWLVRRGASSSDSALDALAPDAEPHALPPGDRLGATPAGASARVPRSSPATPSSGSWPPP